MDKDEAKRAITGVFSRHGITQTGFCAFKTLETRLIHCRAQSRLPENSRTVIICLFPYMVQREKPSNISRYAAVPDYHRVCGEYLCRIAAELKEMLPGFRFEPFIDNSPIPEVFAAASAGLGVRGDNGLLINSLYGSRCFIGELVSDIEIPCESLYSECPHCGACRAACPKDKYTGVCLSAVSQKKGELSVTETAALKENGIVWGCDICAEVCPLNENSAVTCIPEFINGYRSCYTAGEDINNRAYEWRGEKTVRRNGNL